MLKGNETAALQFSGGKDSLALLHLAKPYLDRITVFFGDTGAVYPHVLKFVQDTCSDLKANLVIVKPKIDVLEYTKQYGLPSDIVPINATPDMAWMMPEKPKQLLQSPLSCCGNMLFVPMYHAIKERGLKIVLRGSKNCDPHRTVPNGFKDEQAIEYRSPLWDWSDEDVMTFLSDKKMADQYPEIMDSMDCWACTGHMSGKYAGKKLQYAKKNYPDLWPQLVDRIERVRETVLRESTIIGDTFAEARI